MVGCSVEQVRAGKLGQWDLADVVVVCVPAGLVCSRCFGQCAVGVFVHVVALVCLSSFLACAQLCLCSSCCFCSVCVLMRVVVLVST